MIRKLTEFTAVLLVALVTGVFWGTWFTLTRSLENFSAAEFIHIGKTIIANVALPMRLLMPATIMLQALAMWQNYRGNKGSFYIYAFSLALMILTLVITVAVEVPIDNKIKTWTENSLPADWEGLRQTWDRFHTIRAFTSLASLGLFAAGMIRRMK